MPLQAFDDRKKHRLQGDPITRRIDKKYLELI